MDSEFERTVTGPFEELVRFLEGGGRAFQNVPEALVSKAYDDAGWPETKAIECMFAKSNFSSRAPPFSAIVELFRRYETAKNQGFRLSLGGLSDGLMNPATAYRVLKKVGLGSMIRRIDRRVLTEEQIAAIERANETRFSNADIGHFVGTSGQTVRNHLGLGRIRRPVKNFGTYKLTWARASNIYFLADRGEEIYDVPSKVTAYAFAGRSEISSSLVADLRVMFPDKGVNEPYLTRVA